MRDFHNKTLVRRFRAQTDDGYMVVECDISSFQPAHPEDDFSIFQPAHPEGYFSITADVYTSERAYKAGNTNAIHACGMMHDQIGAAFPELVPFFGMHGADAVTGENMHVEANAWYYFQTAFDIEGGWTASQYDRIPEDKTESAEAYSRMCHTLKVSEENFPGLHMEVRARELLEEQTGEVVYESRGEWARFMRAALTEYINNELRPRWKAEAEAFRAFLAEAPESPTDEPEEAVEAGQMETFKLTLEGASGPLTVTSKLDGEEYDEIGGHFIYKVVVKGTGEPKTYTSRFWASTHDYEHGKIDAREAAFGILREILDIYWDEDGELKDLMQEQTDATKRAASLRAYKRATTFAEAYWGTLEDNNDLIGR